MAIRCHLTSERRPDGTPSRWQNCLPQRRQEGPVPRSWDWWTEQKLDILADYLAGFTRASKKAGTTVYLDLFAGQPDNVSRERDERQIHGSARRALDTSPPLSVLRFFELDATARKLGSA